MTTGKTIPPHSARMTANRSPLTRFVFHSLWVILPFCALLVWTWITWRTDAATRRDRLMESARRYSQQMLDEVTRRLGPWSPIPGTDPTGTPPIPNHDPKAREVLKRYEAGDFEAVLGSPESLRSEAGLPLRSLAAIQLLRRETDPARLAELASTLAESADFSSPVFIREAERRFGQLKLDPPPAFAQWRAKWHRAATEAALARQIDANQPATWQAHDGTRYLIETRPGYRDWRVTREADVIAAAQATEFPGLPEGMNLVISAAGKPVAGPTGKFPLFTVGGEVWTCQVVVDDAGFFERSEASNRNFILLMISLTALAGTFGLVQAGRAYLQAVELSRRQGEFMAAVSHEMRTPLAAMRLLAENLESGVADRTGQRGEHTKLIREECARLGGLVDNVLAFTRDRKPEPHEAFDLPSMVEDVASLMKPLAERRNIHFEVVVSPFPEPPHGDVSALRRAALNLLDNALKHTPDHGKISCRVFPVDAAWWALEVCDTGPGIPLDERERIFEAFYRIGDELRRSTPGTGLGLALVKRSAETHGGRIEVGENPQGGSCFTMTLPLHPPTP
jgi:signal transduction histidine kinase